ncbi:MAG TPA: hypothetical protein VFN96_02170, partial [Gemmatimonadales bacterium]|nr:hypothetical protein [Gemmatimonadales bacterium]
ARIGKSFRHDSFGFPLENAHGAVTCAACHTSLDFGRVERTCAACHEDVHRGELGVECSRCHTTGTFEDRTPAARAHDLTRLPLMGAHRAVDCRDCHAAAAGGGGGGTLAFRGVPSECGTCHRAEYMATTTPAHASAGYSTACGSCHTAAAWQGAFFDHQGTQFPLTGAHRAIPCQGCHADNLYDGKPSACIACHQTDWDGTTSPVHQAAGFSTTCTDCHTTTAWPGVVYNHQGTQFPLTGAHVAAPCQSCHADNVYDGKPAACVSCHQTEYNQSADPNHAAAGFPTDCTACHTTTTWQGARFEHDAPYFPIYSGKHAGKWTSCASCHVNQAAYADFTCLTCHEHSQADMDSKHQGRTGYQYASQACYSCHPRGD